MNILHVTAQKPSSTGSGVYLTQLARAIGGFLMSGNGRQGVMAGVCEEDITAVRAELGEHFSFYPVIFESDALPFPVFGMSDVMPYPSSQYHSMTDDQRDAFKKAFISAADQAVRELKPDVILCHHLYLLTALMREHFPDIPVYGFCHNTDLSQFRSHGLARDLIGRQIPKLDGIFALHSQQKDSIRALFGVPESRISVTGAGYDPDVFYADRSREHAPGEPVRIVFAGKIAAAKGVPSLIRAMTVARERTDISFDLILAGSAGDPEEYRSIKELTASCPYPVSLPGRLTHRELADLYRAGGLFVLPSFNEGLPLCVIEALACGMRVVMTDLPGVRDWIDSAIDAAPVTYIALPDNDLSVFESDLADAVTASAASGPTAAPDLSALTWASVAERVLSIICARLS